MIAKSINATIVNPTPAKIFKLSVKKSTIAAWHGSVAFSGHGKAGRSVVVLNPQQLSFSWMVWIVVSFELFQAEEAYS